ncbi:MAG: beta-ketoacyl synthase chain length factor [Candidatus Brocadia sp.]|nr:beta-ketoacyl synthase chain length factor [Candidatus Brocadia sp.]
MEKLVLTGVGMVTPMGIGREQFWNNVINGSSGIKRLTKFPTTHETYCGEISDFHFDVSISNNRFRRAADISKYTLTAVNLAISDAGTKTLDDKDTALVVGITHGALNYAQTFHKALVTEGVDDLSPIHFSDSVLNAPAGNVSIGFGIKGPIHTLVGGATTAIKAVMLASRMLDSGVASKSIVVSSEALNELSLYCYSRLGIHTLSEGSGAILIEKEGKITGTTPYCYIAGMASGINPSNSCTALNTVVDQCLEKADISPKDIDLVMTDSCVPVKSGLTDIPAGCIMPLSGNAFSLTVMLDIIVSSLAIKNGTIPEAIVRNAVSISDSLQNVLIYSTEEDGIAAAMVLSKCL